MVYENLKNAIRQAIKQNGNQEITGSILQSTLLNIINTIGADYKFLGFASPSTVPPTSEEGRLFYFASESGEYVNFPTSDKNTWIVIGEGLCMFTKEANSDYWKADVLIEVAEEPGSNKMSVPSLKLYSNNVFLLYEKIVSLSNEGEELPFTKYITTSFINCIFKRFYVLIDNDNYELRYIFYYKDKKFVKIDRSVSGLDSYRIDTNNTFDSIRVVYRRKDNANVSKADFGKLKIRLHPEISQVAGDADDKVMSQKATTEFIQKSINGVDTKIGNLSSAITNVNTNTGINDYPIYNTKKYYYIGDIVCYKDVIYVFIADHKPGEWNINHVKNITLKTVLENSINSLDDNVYNNRIFFKNIIIRANPYLEQNNTNRVTSNYFLGYGFTVKVNENFIFSSLYCYDELGNLVTYKPLADVREYTIPNDGYIHRIGFARKDLISRITIYDDFSTNVYDISKYDSIYLYKQIEDLKNTKHLALFDKAIYLGDSISSTSAVYGGKPVGVLLQEWGIINNVEVLAVLGSPIKGCITQLDAATIKNPDIVFVSTGVNSWGSNSGIGEWFKENVSDKQTTRRYITEGNTIKAMYMSVYQSIRAKYPKTKIIFTTVIKKADNSRTVDYAPYNIYSPSYLMKHKDTNMYLDELRQVILEMPKVCNVYAMDMWQMCGLDPTIPEQLSEYFYDKTHPNTKGHIEMAKAMVGFLKSIVN